MRMFLVKNGVPYDVAISANEALALAMYITLGEFEGNKWDWEQMRWQPRR